MRLLTLGMLAFGSAGAAGTASLLLLSQEAGMTYSQMIGLLVAGMGVLAGAVTILFRTLVAEMRSRIEESIASATAWQENNRLLARLPEILEDYQKRSEAVSKDFRDSASIMKKAAEAILEREPDS